MCPLIDWREPELMPVLMGVLKSRRSAKGRAETCVMEAHFMSARNLGPYFTIQKPL